MEYEPSKEDILQIREWLRKMPHLVQDYSDEFLIAFIKFGKGSLQKAKDRLEKFNKIGMKFPEFCGSLDPLHPQLQEHLSAVLIFPLPVKTDDNCTLLFFCKNPKCQDPTKYHQSETYRYFLLSTYVLLWENKCSGKWMFFADLKDINMAHLKDMTPTSAKRQSVAFTTYFPWRLRSLTVISLSSVIEWLFNVFKYAMKKKLSERVHIKTSLDEIQVDDYPKNILPKEYGGSGESVFVLHENWKKKVESYRERFLEEELKMRKLDPLRPKTDDEDDMTGTFRQLNVD